MRFPNSGPFAKQPAKQIPPPYGTIAPANVPTKPLANQSPLGMASADPTPPLPPDEPHLIPPKSEGVIPVSASLPGDEGLDGLPPFRRKSDPVSPPAPPKLSKPPMMEQPLPPGATPPANKNLAELKSLVATASSAWRAVNTYETTVTRRELNPKGKIESDVALFQYRKDPLSVHTVTISESGKGRELVYNPGQYKDKLYVKLGKGDPFPGAGYIPPALSPDDELVKERARYSIRDAGFGTPINKLAGWVAALEAGKIPADLLTFDGPVNRSEWPYPLVGVTHKMRAGDEPLFPKGGVKHYFFDMKRESPSYGLPVLVIATDASGKEVEYYLFEKIKLPTTFTDADFNPDRLGKKK